MKTCCEQEAHNLEELAKHGAAAETATYGTISAIAKPQSNL